MKITKKTLATMPSPEILTKKIERYERAVSYFDHLFADVPGHESQAIIGTYYYAFKHSVPNILGAMHKGLVKAGLHPSFQKQVEKLRHKMNGYLKQADIFNANRCLTDIKGYYLDYNGEWLQKNGKLVDYENGLLVYNEAVENALYTQIDKLRHTRIIKANADYADQEYNLIQVAYHAYKDPVEAFSCDLTGQTPHDKNYSPGYADTVAGHRRYIEKHLEKGKKALKSKSMNVKKRYMDVGKGGFYTSMKLANEDVQDEIKRTQDTIDYLDSMHFNPHFILAYHGDPMNPSSLFHYIPFEEIEKITMRKRAHDFFKHHSADEVRDLLKMEN